MCLKLLLLVIACIYTYADSIALTTHGLVALSGWTRIASCNGGGTRNMILTDDRTLKDIQDLASTSQIVLFYSTPYIYAMSSPESYPIQNLRGGFELSFSVGDDGTLVTTPDKDNVWLEHTNSMPRMMNICTPVETLRSFESIAYHACGNLDGLHMADELLFCKWSWTDIDREISVYIGSPDPQCRTGISYGRACCMSSCGTCGGFGCDLKPGGGPGCCAERISGDALSCIVSPPPCLMPWRHTINSGATTDRVQSGYPATAAIDGVVDEKGWAYGNQLPANIYIAFAFAGYINRVTLLTGYRRTYHDHHIIDFEIFYTADSAADQASTWTHVSDPYFIDAVAGGSISGHILTCDGQDELIVGFSKVGALGFRVLVHDGDAPNNNAVLNEIYVWYQDFHVDGYSLVESVACGTGDYFDINGTDWQVGFPSECAETCAKNDQCIAFNYVLCPSSNCCGRDDRNDYSCASGGTCYFRTSASICNADITSNCYIKQLAPTTSINQTSPTLTLYPTPTLTLPPMPIPSIDPTLRTTSSPTGKPTNPPVPLPTSTLPVAPLPTPNPALPPTSNPAIIPAAPHPAPNPALPSPFSQTNPPEPLPTSTLPVAPLPTPNPALPSPSNPAILPAAPHPAPNPALPSPFSQTVLSPSNTEVQNQTYVVFQASDTNIPQIVPYNATFNPQEFMIEFWTRPKHLTASYLVRSENKLNASGYGLLLQEWTIGQKIDDGDGDDNDDGRDFFWACEVFDGDKSFRVLSSQPAQVNARVHLACFYSQSQLVLYVDAVYQNYVNASLNINVDADLYIGENYDGTITHLTIYDTTSIQINYDTVNNIYDSSCSLYGFCEGPPLPTTTSPPTDDYGECAGTDGNHCSPLDPFNPYYAIAFIILISVLTLVAFCISRRRNKSLAMHSSILIAGLSVIGFIADTSFTVQLTIERSHLTVYAWAVLSFSAVLNIAFMSKILWTEFKTLETATWLSNHVTATALIVTLSISNCDALQLLYSRVHPVLCAPIGHQSKKRLVVYSLISHFTEHIPQWILQFIAVRSNPSAIIPFFSLIISSLSIIIGITKRMLRLISMKAVKNRDRDIGGFGSRNNRGGAENTVHRYEVSDSDQIPEATVQRYQVSDSTEISEYIDSFEETLDGSDESYTHTYESSVPKSGVTSQAQSSVKARTERRPAQDAHEAIPENDDAVYALVQHTAQPGDRIANSEDIEMQYLDRVQTGSVRAGGHNSNNEDIQMTGYDRVKERTEPSVVV